MLGNTETRPVEGPWEPSYGELDAALAVMASPEGSAALDALEDDGPDPEPGDVIGRYTVLGLLGRGGMGSVHHAYDPQLDRNVALKLLRPVGRPGAQSDLRLLREAQMLARVQHPNVVAVFDAGLTERGVFIAMELCEGLTLKEWLDQRHPQVPEILAVFRAAGRGLVAVHQAGFVHRDFKPSNVLVGHDGAVRVLDFGIASLMDPASLQEEPSTVSLRPVVRPPGVPEPLAVVGSGRLSSDDGLVVGTPRFMAPEQLMGQRADHRSEQFTFCVCLHLALYGASPLVATSYAARREAMMDGRVLDEAALLCGATPGAVPARVRSALLRGLSPDPADRFPSMLALLDELEPTMRRWPWVLVGLAVTTSLAAGLALALAPGDPCAEPGAVLASTWDGHDREAVRMAFARSGHLQAAALHERVEEQLDGYAEAWRSTYVQSCRATFVTRKQSELLHDHRMRCLERRRARMRSTIDALAEIDQPQQAIDRTLLPFVLPPLSECSDLDAVMASNPLPPDEGARETIAELRRRIDRAQTLHAAGETQAGLRLAQSVVDEAHASGFAPVVAEALGSLGSLQAMGGSAREAQATLETAIFEAARAKDDVTAATAWTWLLYALLQQHELERGVTLELAARAAVRRVDDDELQGWLLNNLGALYSERKDAVLARAYMQQALELKTRALGPGHVDVGISWANLGTALANEGRSAEARRAFDEARVVFEGTVGPAHPLTYQALGILCGLELDEGRPRRAVELCGRVLEHFEASPASNVTMGNIHFFMAQALWRVGGREAPARQHARRAIELVWSESPAMARDIAAWLERPAGLRPAGGE